MKKNAFESTGSAIVETIFSNTSTTTDTEYFNIFLQGNGTQTGIFTTIKGRAGQIMGGGFSSNVQRGVRTTKQVKRIGCSNMKTMIENHKIFLNDYDLVNEMSTFTQKGNSYEAEQGSHDDLVM